MTNMFIGWKRKSSKLQNAPRHRATAFVQSDVGCVRDSNEDNGKFIKPTKAKILARRGVLLLVADGMGGHSAGERASSMAVEIISKIYYKSKGSPKSALQKAFLAANRQIYKASLKKKELQGMGTTCTALVLQNGSTLMAHIGDSRLYLLRGEDIYLMSEDHTAVMEMVKHRIISPEEARNHEDRNVVLRALGTQPTVEVSLWDEPMPVRAGDQFVLCSDGLHDLIDDDEIKQIAASENVKAACGKMIALAKKRGGYDNITVGIVSLKKQVKSRKKIAKETREANVTNLKLGPS